jgi:precorrin-6A/cobalt-precorrin-6A reductase
VIVSKNAGTAATAAKIEAARELGLPVVMLARPVLPPAQTVASWQSALDWLEGLHDAGSSRRGV